MTPHPARVFAKLKWFLLLGFLALILFAGGRSFSGRMLFSYEGSHLPTPTEGQYVKDVHAVVSYFTERGFHEVVETNAPEPTQPANRKEEIVYELEASLEHPIPLSRPVALRIYTVADRSMILATFAARNPTWALSWQSRVRSEALDSRLMHSYWQEHLASRQRRLQEKGALLQGQARLK